MKALSLAILSDLHIGRGARSRDLCPHDDSRAFEDDYVKTFLAFLKDEKIRADYLVLPGDITHEAHPQEVALASRTIKSIAKVLKVAGSKIIFVPGNHDVDWAVLRLPDTTGLRRAQRFDPLRQRDQIFQRIVTKGTQKLLEEPYSLVWESADLLAVGYNSAWHDDPGITVHSGNIDSSHISLLRARFEAMDFKSDKLRLFLVHHHPVLYSEPASRDADFSAMINAEELLDLLREYRFDMLIHGHKHHPRLRSHIVNSGFPLVVFAAGSFSLLLDSRWSGRVNNQFHLLKVESRDAVSNCVRGQAQSWTYVYGPGWTPSQLSNGIRHVELFGSYVQPSELQGALRPVISSLLSTREWTSWEIVTSSLPNLRHLPSERVTEALDGLSVELQFKRHGQPPEETILLKVI